jgi:steroid 5-alpha reductase family enzyme
MVSLSLPVRETVMTELFLINAALIASLMTAVWLASLLLRNVAIIDIAWGMGFLIIGWSSWLFASDSSGDHPFQIPSRWVLPGLTTLWGLRLSLYLAWRNLGKPEDKRYAAMRRKRGNSFWWQSLFIIFGLQGVLMWIVSLPVQVGIVTALPGWRPLHFLGLALWAVGFFFESVGDWQLAKFKSHPHNAGRVLDRGLWRYTRHPNYFGDFCVWWGLWFISVAHLHGLWTLISPALMSLLLLRVSGVTLLESTLIQEKPEYEQYVRRTSPFFPWPP